MKSRSTQPNNQSNDRRQLNITYTQYTDLHSHLDYRDHTVTGIATISITDRQTDRQTDKLPLLLLLQHLITSNQQTVESRDSLVVSVLD